MAKKGGQKTTTTQQLDPSAQAYADAQRAAATQGANAVGAAPNPFVGPQTQSVGNQAAAFFNPYQTNVINSVNQQFDKLNNQAISQTNAQATNAGAFGGSRQGVAQGVRQGALDASRMGLISQLQNSGYQNALSQGTAYAEQQRQAQQQQNMGPAWQQQQRMQLLNMGMGPYGQTTTTTAPPGSKLGGAIGGAEVGSAFGPWGAAIGGGLGLLGGYL